MNEEEIRRVSAYRAVAYRGVLDGKLRCLCGTWMRVTGRTDKERCPTCWTVWTWTKGNSEGER